ncbi:MAG: universal stress protein [Bacteroidetes bacterium]|nr:universal stress protein [Bacteroidota bacterium]MBS1934332.1 universal stress protein [Bacteroidota bacterium]
MFRSFKNILIPVDFSLTTEIAVRKSLELIDPEGSTVHLLHVLLPKFSKSSHYDKTTTELLKWKKIIDEIYPGFPVNIHIVEGKHVEEAVIKKAEEIKPDLIIIAKNSNRKWFSFNKIIDAGNLATETHCATLVIKPGSVKNQIRSIVIPVVSRVPARKLDMLIPLAARKKATVFLLSMMSEATGFDDSSTTHALIETYRILKGEVNCQVYHKIISGNNIARAALQFARMVDADVLLVNPDESRVSSFARLDITDMLMRDSKLQVLAIDPYARNN